MLLLVLYLCIVYIYFTSKSFELRLKFYGTRPGRVLIALEIYKCSIIYWTRPLIEVDTVFRIFALFKNASGSRLKSAKTQLLLLGNLQNALVPQRFHDFVTNRLKFYGFFVTPDGLDDPRTGKNARIL